MREIDALIAEKVMGCSVVKVDGLLMCDCSKYPLHDVGNNNELRAYSTSIAHAFEVVEKMGSNNSINLSWRPYSGPANAFQKKDGMWNCTVGLYEVAALTAPMAICLAALRALGVGVPGGEK